MQDRTATQFSHVKPGDTVFRSEGLRDFFLNRDLGIEEATQGRVIAQLVKANMAPEKGTGWHRHEAQFHIVLMLKGRALWCIQRAALEQSHLPGGARGDSRFRLRKKTSPFDGASAGARKTLYDCRHAA